MFQITLKSPLPTPRSPPPQEQFLFHIQSSLQVGSGLRFTDDTQKQDSLMHFVKINDSLSLSSEIVNLAYICRHTQNNTRLRCQRSWVFWGKKAMENKFGRQIPNPDQSRNPLILGESPKNCFKASQKLKPFVWRNENKRNSLL